ncbi:hypothetical protein SANA_08500 [Gottschalkiaceae bacterium SANA]|nr:hypothetical protein SANA_08500 [Gottschalkiaceae bacterium SANA]
MDLLNELEYAERTERIEPLKEVAVERSDEYWENKLTEMRERKSNSAKIKNLVLVKYDNGETMVMEISKTPSRDYKILDMYFLEHGIAEKLEMPDLLAWTKEYLDAGDAAFAGGTVEEYQAAISEFVGEELLAKNMEMANESVADVEINGKVYTREDKLGLIFGEKVKRVKITTDFSPVYSDMNSERDFFKYVFVRSTWNLYDENDDLIREMSSTKINMHWFQKQDDQWVLYSAKEVAWFPYDGKEHTRDFNGEPIAFTHYKDNEISLTQ